jgi:hypothetical protein
VLATRVKHLEPTTLPQPAQRRHGCALEDLSENNTINPSTCSPSNALFNFNPWHAYLSNLSYTQIYLPPWDLQKKVYVNSKILITIRLYFFYFFLFTLVLSTGSNHLNYITWICSCKLHCETRWYKIKQKKYYRLNQANLLLRSDTTESILWAFAGRRSAARDVVAAAPGSTERSEPPPFLAFDLLCPVTAAPTADRPVPVFRDLFSALAQLAILSRSRSFSMTLGGSYHGQSMSDKPGNRTEELTSGSPSKSI